MIIMLVPDMKLSCTFDGTTGEYQTAFLTVWYEYYNLWFKNDHTRYNLRYVSGW